MHSQSNKTWRNKAARGREPEERKALHCSRLPGSPPESGREIASMEGERREGAWEDQHLPPAGLGSWEADLQVEVPPLMPVGGQRTKSESCEADVAPQKRDRFLELCWLLAFLRREEAIISDVTEVVTQPAAGEITTKSVNSSPRYGSRKGSQYREA